MPERTTLSASIRTKDEGTRLIDFLSGRFRYQTRDKWAELVRCGDVRVNGSEASAGFILKRKHVVSYSVLLNEPPVDKDIQILHDEAAFLVACKSGNLPSHADGNYIKHTFIYLLKETMQARGYTGYLNLIHRLDRETSGLMIVSKTKEAGRALSLQFGAGDVEKEYTAVARGRIEGETIELDGPIASDPESVISIRKRVVPPGTPDTQSAYTRFEVLDRLTGYTVLRCSPRTGRTNQIRIHLAHLGHALAGDKLYGRSDDQFLEYLKAARAGRYEPLPWMDAPRQMLHAAGISFNHPESGERMSFRCPMPSDMAAFIEMQPPCTWR